MDDSKIIDFNKLKEEKLSKADDLAEKEDIPKQGEELSLELFESMRAKKEEAEAKEAEECGLEGDDEAEFDIVTEADDEVEDDEAEKDEESEYDEEEVVGGEDVPVDGDDESDVDEDDHKKGFAAVAETIALVILIIAIFAIAIYAKIKLDKAAENEEKSQDATENNVSQNADKYAWWEERDVTEGVNVLEPEATSDDVMEVGDRIFFGSYFQGAEGEKQALSWIILEVDEDFALVTTEYVIDTMPFDDEGVIQWEDSDIRNWLNSEFKGAAFSEEEKSKIMCFEIENESNQEYNTDGGHNTDDEIFLLSFNDVSEYFGEIDKKCYATPYTLEKGVNQGSNDYVTYWLRSPGSVDIMGSEPGYAANIDFTGAVKYYGNDVTLEGIGIRPAMWIKVNTGE